MTTGAVRPRSRWLVPGLAVLLCLAAARSSVATPVRASENEAPRAHARNPLVDLGVVRVGDPARAVFELENRGNALLRIERVDTGCACTLADFDESIEPGQVGRVSASLITAQLVGPVVKGVLVHTNDPRQGTIRLTLKADIVGALSLLPQPVIYMRRRSGQAPVGRVLVRRGPSEEGALVVHELSTSDPWLVATATRLDLPQPRGGGLPAGYAGDWIVEVRFRDDLPRFGEQHANLTLRTGLVRQPEVVLDVESNLEAPVRLSTTKLVLAPTTAGALQGTLFASVREGLDPAQLVVNAEPSGLDVRVTPATERMVQVDVSWSSGKLDGASVIFRLGGDSVRVPVELSLP